MYSYKIFLFLLILIIVFNFDSKLVKKNLINLPNSELINPELSMNRTNKIARILGWQSWNSLTGKIIKNQRVEINGCGDIHPYLNGPIFNGTRTLFLNRCDKNFVYYWLNERRFPNIKTIYLSSHPCEPVVLRRFTGAHIYLSNWFGSYKIR